MSRDADLQPEKSPRAAPRGLRSVIPGDVAILFRTLSNVALYEEALRRQLRDAVARAEPVAVPQLLARVAPSVKRRLELSVTEILQADRAKGRESRVQSQSTILNPQSSIHNPQSSILNRTTREFWGPSCTV